LICIETFSNTNQMFSFYTELQKFKRVGRIIYYSPDTRTTFYSSVHFNYFNTLSKKPPFFTFKLITFENFTFRWNPWVLLTLVTINGVYNWLRVQKSRVHFLTYLLNFAHHYYNALAPIHKSVDLIFCDMHVYNRIYIFIWIIKQYLILITEVGVNIDQCSLLHTFKSTDWHYNFESVL